MTLINIKDKISNRAFAAFSRERYLVLDAFFKSIKEYAITLPVHESLELRELIAKTESDMRMKSLD
jgi:hypothetical protein